MSKSSHVWLKGNGSIAVRRAAGLVLLAACQLSAETSAGFPAADEMLRYSVSWPSGLSVGEAQLQARKTGGGWDFQLTVDAAVPGFAIVDRYRSAASAQLCSLEFEKDTAHGRRKGSEKTTFDYRKATARRVTNGGGKSDIPIPACVRDALDFVFYTRRELGQGRVPPAQTVMAGASYEVRVEYSGAQTIRLANSRREADRVLVSVKGPNSDLSFEVYFARDAARTPLLIQCPFSLGTFSLELVR